MHPLPPAPEVLSAALGGAAYHKPRFKSSCRQTHIPPQPGEEVYLACLGRDLHVTYGAAFSATQARYQRSKKALKKRYPLKSYKNPTIYSMCMPWRCVWAQELGPLRSSDDSRPEGALHPLHEVAPGLASRLPQCRCGLSFTTIQKGKSVSFNCQINYHAHPHAIVGVRSLATPSSFSLLC